jgi:hypothetical protein
LFFSDHKDNTFIFNGGIKTKNPKLFLEVQGFLILAFYYFPLFKFWTSHIDSLCRHCLTLKLFY